MNWRSSLNGLFALSPWACYGGPTKKGTDVSSRPTTCGAGLESLLRSRNCKTGSRSDLRSTNLAANHRLFQRNSVILRLNNWANTALQALFFDRDSQNPIWQ